MDRENNVLPDSNLLLEQIFENAADGMCILNMEYEIIKISNQLANSLALIKEEVIGKKCYEVTFLPLCSTENCPIKRIKRGESYFTYEAHFNIANNTVPFLISATPLIDSNKQINGVILSYKNITDLIRYQEELQVAKSKAEEENFLKSQLLANISHEIRTPMNGIQGLIKMLSETNLSPKQREYMDLIKYSSDRLLSILNNILDFSRIKSQKIDIRKNEFNIILLLDNMRRYFQLQAEEKGLKFYWKLNEKVPQDLIGDPDSLNQVLFNLLSNAIKFTESGHVSLEIDILDEDDKNIELSFSVIDTGIGIPESKIEDIFKEFYQLDLSSSKKYKGSGLGLTITKGLVEAMEGEIEVYSQLGSGSKFTVKLKFNKSLSLEDSNNVNKEQSYKIDEFQNIKVLVVEDDFINQKIINNLLAKNKWDLTIAANGDEVLELIKNNNYNLIILDIYMPGIDGYEIAKKIRELESKYGGYTPIIAITATNTTECRVKCANIGFDEFIIKPIQEYEAYKKIISVINKKVNCDLICLDDLIDRIDNDEELLKELVEELISESYEKEFLGNMLTYIDSGDLKKLKKTVHKFKGSISYFGAGRIIELLKEIEANIEKANMDRVKELYEEVKCEFMNLKEIYGRIIESKDLYLI